jgi:hypothetical protein
MIFVGFLCLVDIDHHDDTPFVPVTHCLLYQTSAPPIHDQPYLPTPAGAGTTQTSHP